MDFSLLHEIIRIIVLPVNGKAKQAELDTVLYSNTQDLKKVCQSFDIMCENIRIVLCILKS